MPIQPLMIIKSIARKKGCRQIYDYIPRANTYSERKWDDEFE
jgi:hypothetical protein